MCTECGCGLPVDAKLDAGDGADHVHSSHAHEHVDENGNVYTHSHAHSESHASSHSHSHSNSNAHSHSHSTSSAHVPGAAKAGHDLVEINKSILEDNSLKAEENREIFKGLGLLAVNVLSSPGSGKTTLLKSLIELLNQDLKAGVVVGDLETDNDARRLRESGAPVVQISTGTLCHLDAGMVAGSIEKIDIANLDLLFIENVGNLVCPATFDLGEELKVVLLSVTEGEDKPLKYPPVFRFADIVVISKSDLAQACEFNRDLAIENIGKINPRAQIVEVSGKTGVGMPELKKLLLKERQEILAPSS